MRLYVEPSSLALAGVNARVTFGHQFTTLVGCSGTQFLEHILYMDCMTRMTWLTMSINFGFSTITSYPMSLTILMLPCHQNNC